MDTTFDRVRGILVELPGVAPERVTLESRLMDDLEADQLDFTEALMSVESEFGIQTPDGESANLRTVGDLVNYVDTHPASA